MVRANPEEFAFGMTRKGLYKEFLDEIGPLSQYAVKAYPPTYAIQPVLGNQRYDAIVYNDSGTKVDRLELTWPRDGAEAAIDARLVSKRGFGRAKVGKPGDDIDALLPQVLKTCRDKAQKDYGDCTLVIILDVLSPFPGFEGAHEKKLQTMVSAISDIKFKAKRVVLFVLPNRVLPIDG